MSDLDDRPAGPPPGHPERPGCAGFVCADERILWTRSLVDLKDVGASRRR